MDIQGERRLIASRDAVWRALNDLDVLREYAPSVLGSNSIVVLLTDGLERGPPEELRAAAERLTRSCREVLWLNPLLRYADYAPLARGASVLAEILSPVRPAHDPASFEALVRSLEALRRRGEPTRAARTP
ncbi:MAG TPA: VWA domain-containing protein [Geobacterales bacterium]|nr:VWA domain-containing protein [Geobacterales bacterium]